MRLSAFVCLSVCLQDYSKTRAWIWMKCCVTTDVGTWTNWLTFQPDPDHSPDAGTGKSMICRSRSNRHLTQNRLQVTWCTAERYCLLHVVVQPTAHGLHRRIITIFPCGSRKGAMDYGLYWRPIGSRIWAFQIIPKIQDGWDPPSWKSTWRHFFLLRVLRFA